MGQRLFCPESSPRAVSRKPMRSTSKLTPVPSHCPQIWVCLNIFSLQRSRLLCLLASLSKAALLFFVNGESRQSIVKSKIMKTKTGPFSASRKFKSFFYTLQTLQISLKQTASMVPSTQGSRTNWSKVSFRAFSEGHGLGEPSFHGMAMRHGLSNCRWFTKETVELRNKKHRVSDIPLNSDKWW